MNLNELKKEIPFKWRVQSANQYGASCVAYIDSRQVQDLLDEVCGSENWQCKFEEYKGNLFASIGICVSTELISKDGERHLRKDWVWKSDCGTESNVEKQKGEASDAFKRAAVMWGIGRFLYSKKIVKLKTKQENNKWIPVDNNGNKIWDVTKHINSINNTLMPEEILLGCENLKELGVEYGKLSDENKVKYKDLASRLKNRLK